jgi:hypothetical protein
MIFRRALLLLLCVAALAGCATGPQMKDTGTLPPGQGVMVARIAMPYLANKAHLWTTIAVSNQYDPSDSGMQIKLSDAETFLVLPMRAGSYRWKSLEIAGYNAEFGPMDFDIVAGKINYVGDLTLVMEGPYDNGRETYYKAFFRPYDYHDVFLPRIAAAYPKLWANYPVVVDVSSYPDTRFFGSGQKGP